MTNKPTLTLIISSPGTLQDGLLALITTIPQVSAVMVAEDINSALRMIENHQPALIILELSSCKVQDIINQINTQSSHINLIVLVENISQQKEAEASGADRVLVKGFPAHKLISIVEELMGIMENTPSIQTNSEGGMNAE